MCELRKYAMHVLEDGATNDVFEASEKQGPLCGGCCSMVIGARPPPLANTP